VYVNVSVRDGEGRLVPTASNEIEFSVEGPGEIIATDNGDETDFADFHSLKRKAFGGLAQAIIRPKEGSSGFLLVKVRSCGLGESVCRVNILSK
jgi:beta-galactosidase